MTQSEVGPNVSPPKAVFITGSAGFIGYHLCELLLDNGYTVIGFDAHDDYYDPILKSRREDHLIRHPKFTTYRGRLEEKGLLLSLFEKYRPHIVVHLAAQAGVRYSIENPRAYLDANIIGTFEILEAARAFPPQHLLMASTSSVYGANEVMPYAETHKVDSQMSFYAATKKANEAMSHSYAHLYGIPITMFRFFTVYGPWGRPDMALFKFVKAIYEGREIDVYNNGDMRRDFTYVSDLVRAIKLLFYVPPIRRESCALTPTEDSQSPVAPWRVVNIGNSSPVQLLDFINAIETATGRIAKKNMMPMQAGDVPATWADASLLKLLTGYTPQTDVATGVKAFVEWYQDYYEIVG